MATAVQNSTEPRTTNPRAKLARASLFGAAFVMLGVAVAAYFVPQFWKTSISPVIAPLGSFFDVAFRLIAQVVSAGLVIWVGTRLAGSNPPHGLRGGIFLTVSLLIAVFFVIRAVWLNLEDYGAAAQLATVVVLGALCGLGFRFLLSTRAERWMKTIEDQGWLSTFSYKRTQGQRMRRYTMLGVLLIGWSGVYTIISSETLGRGDWTLRLPFSTDPADTITPLADIHYSVPVLLGVLTFWFAWRLVNMPSFADFLIATEAEMNKVSWPTRKRLFQDTIVVLVTTLLLTLFLLLVDVFWGWLLSHRWVGVLPTQTNTASQVDPLQGKKVDW